MKKLILTCLATIAFFTTIYAQRKNYHTILFTKDFLQYQNKYKFRIVGASQLSFNVEVIEGEKIKVTGISKPQRIILVNTKKGAQYLKIFFSCPSYLEVSGTDPDLNKKKVQSKPIQVNLECNFHVWQIDMRVEEEDDRNVKYLSVNLIGD